MAESLPLCVEMELAPPAGGADSRFWKPGTQIRVRFLDGDPALQHKVRRAAHEWVTHANLQLSFLDAPAAEIRITFGEPSLWCYIGTDALLVPKDRPTMCLGALTPATEEAVVRKVVLHEFGHVLGLVHEHQNPAAAIPWDRQALAFYISRFVDRGSIGNLIDKLTRQYALDSSQFQFFDPRSIMLAAIPHEITRGNFAIGWNDGLSEADKSFAARIYPASGSSGVKSVEPVSRGGSFGSLDWSHPDEQNEQTRGSLSLREEQIRLDVAYPERAVVDEPFDVAVAVRQPEAPALVIDDLPGAGSVEGTVYRPEGEEVIRYRIEVSGAHCEVRPAHYVILLRRGENAQPRFFQVTAQRPGKQTIFVSAYQEDEALAAQTRVRIEVQLPVQEEPATRFDDSGSRPAALEKPTSAIVLAPAEVKQFKEALLSAFRRPELEQVVYYGLEVRLDDIVRDSTFDKEVNDLVMWANAHNKIMALLKQAREGNDGNVKLQELEAYIEAKRAGKAEA